MNTCFVCQLVGEHDSHHIMPIAYGGPKEGPQVWLCSICHRKIHLVANDVYKGKSKRLESFTPVQWERAGVLVRAIVSSKIQLEAAGKPPDSTQRIMIEIPNHILLRLHIRKKELGFTSLQTFLLTLIKKEAEKVLWK